MPLGFLPAGGLGTQTAGLLSAGCGQHALETPCTRFGSNPRVQTSAAPAAVLDCHVVGCRWRRRLDGQEPLPPLPPLAHLPVQPIEGIGCGACGPAAPVVGGVQLKHALPVVGAQQPVRQRQDAGGLAGAGRPLEYHNDLKYAAAG